MSGTPGSSPASASASKISFADTTPGRHIIFGPRTKRVSTEYGYRKCHTSVALPLDVFVIDVLIVDALPHGTIQYDHEQKRIRVQTLNTPHDAPSMDAHVPVCGAAPLPLPQAASITTTHIAGAPSRVSTFPNAAAHHVAMQRAPIHGCTGIIMGCTADGSNVTLLVKQYRPSFVLECPDHWAQREFDAVAQTLEKKMDLPGGTVRWSSDHLAHYYDYHPDDTNPHVPKRFNCIRLSLPTIALMQQAADKLPWCLTYNGMLTGAREHCKVYEARSVEPESMLMEQLGIVPAGWLRVNAGRVPTEYYTHAEIEVECNVNDVVALPDVNTIPPLIIASFDIECVSDDGSFPKPINNGHEIICINTAVARFGEWKIDRYCHYVGECDQPPPYEDGSLVRLQCYATEGECLEAWRDFVLLDMGWHVRVGYNIFRFDDEFMGVRMARVKPWDREHYGTTMTERRRFPGLSFWRSEMGTAPQAPGAALTRSRFFNMCSVDHFQTPLFESAISTAAMGDNMYRLFTVPGVVSIDLLPYIKNKYRDLDLYGLDYVSHHFLKMNKIDMPPHEIFENHRLGPATRAKIVEYCARDCDLPMLLLRKLQVITDLVEMARITVTTIDQLLISGQTVKSWNQIVRFAHAQQYVMNVPKKPFIKNDQFGDDDDDGDNDIVGAGGIDVDKGQKHQQLSRDMNGNNGAIRGSLPAVATPISASMGNNHGRGLTAAASTKKPAPPASTPAAKKASTKKDTSNDVGYSGAKVFDPIIGFYTMFLIVLDFASLYPSIMQRKNLCLSTIVRNAQHVIDLITAGVPIEQIMSGDNVTKHTFVQSWKGIVPMILEGLKLKRKQVKAEMAKYPKDSAEYMVLDARQNAIKVTMNSLYGVFGSRTGKLSCVGLAESVTKTGRDMIFATRDLIEREYAQYGAKVIYGDTDSVMILLTKVDACDANMPMAMELGHTMAKRGTEYFRSMPEKWASAVELTFEKVYWPYYLQQKKHYAGLMWTAEGYKKTGTFDKIDSKGVASKRRDKFPALRRAIDGVWHQLLRERSVAGAAQVIQTLMQQIIDDALPLEDYILTSEIKSNYKSGKALPPQVCANEKRRSRQPGSEYKSGTRAPFVFVIDKHLRVQPSNVSLRADDPEWVRQHASQYRVDREHYLSLCETPFEHILNICFENGKTIVTDAVNTLKNRLVGQTSLSKFIMSPASAPVLQPLAATANTQGTVAHDSTDVSTAVVAPPPSRFDPTAALYAYDRQQTVHQQQQQEQWAAGPVQHRPDAFVQRGTARLPLATPSPRPEPAHGATIAARRPHMSMLATAASKTVLPALDQPPVAAAVATAPPLSQQPQRTSVIVQSTSRSCELRVRDYSQFKETGNTSMAGPATKKRKLNEPDSKQKTLAGFMRNQ